MKKQIIYCLLAITVATTTLISCDVASIGVSVQPVRPVYVRPPMPSQQHIWIEGDWVWAGGGYAWHEGYWSIPRRGRSWEAGGWEQSPRGYRWRAGHWR